MGFQPLDLDVRRLVLGGIEERLRGKFHEILPALRVAGEQGERAGGLGARLIGAVALQRVGLRAIAEIDLQRAADDRLDAGVRELVGELQRPEQVASVRQPDRGIALRHRQLGDPGVGDGAFQQRIGRMHLQVHEAWGARARAWRSWCESVRSWRTVDGRGAVSTRCRSCPHSHKGSRR